VSYRDVKATNAILRSCAWGCGFDASLTLTSVDSLSGANIP
jgi:hypothetical protein